MGKILIAVLITVAFLGTGCDAFKDYYDTPSGLEDTNLSIVDGGEEGVDTGESLGDFTIDTTECENNSAVTVTATEGEGENSGWTLEDSDETLITAMKDSVYTTSIEIDKGGKKLTFTLKQTGDTAYSVCNILLEGCDGECIAVKSIWNDVESGSININKFSAGDGTGAVINAGDYDLTFGKSSMGDAGVSITGSYFTDALDEAYVE